MKWELRGPWQLWAFASASNLFAAVVTGHELHKHFTNKVLVPHVMQGLFFLWFAGMSIACYFKEKKQRESAKNANGG